MVDLSEGTVFIDSESAHLLGTPVLFVGLAGAEPRIRDPYVIFECGGYSGPL